MFRDTDQALKRLEAALLEEDAAPADTEGTAVFTPIPEKKNTVTNYKAYNTDRSDEDLHTYSETVRKADRSISILSAILLLLCGMILATLILFILRYLEVL